MQQHFPMVIDLIDSELNQIYNKSVEEARIILLSGDSDQLRSIEGSFALIARQGNRVVMARSLDRPMRYFLAKQEEGPVLVVANRIDTIYEWLKTEGFAAQFHPTYTRMVPAHYAVEIQLVGCPDPDPDYARFFTPNKNMLPPDLDQIGRSYISALAQEIGEWLKRLPDRSPVGVCFSGGIDSGAVFLITYWMMQKLSMNPGRLKAFTLDLDSGPDLKQAQSFLEALGLALFLEPIHSDPEELNAIETIRVVEDYKPLDIECATMLLSLCGGIRRRYPEWRYLIDGDGGDENLKDYPIEENPELTIRSVIHNRMLYQEGWGVGTMKHSLTYSGGLSRSFTRTFAPGRHYGFQGFSPFTRPRVIEIAEGIPFQALTDYKVERLYRLKGEIVSRGIQAITGIQMPVFPKRRFQHGVLPLEKLKKHLPLQESEYRKVFLSFYM